jgi:hypothetical protein
MKKIRITLTMTEQEAEWLEQACFVEEEYPHSKFLNHVSQVARRARHAFQHGVHPTDGGLCAVCGYSEYKHSAIGHEFDPAISG